jgi:hypothetical protein
MGLLDKLHRKKDETVEKVKEQTVAYETTLPQKFDNNIKAFCAYHLANSESMHNQQKYTLEHAHYRKVPQVQKSKCTCVGLRKLSTLSFLFLI